MKVYLAGIPALTDALIVADDNGVPLTVEATRVSPRSTKIGNNQILAYIVLNKAKVYGYIVTIPHPDGGKPYRAFRYDEDAYDTARKLINRRGSEANDNPEGWDNYNRIHLGTIYGG